MLTAFVAVASSEPLQPSTHELPLPPSPSSSLSPPYPPLQPESALNQRWCPAMCPVPPASLTDSDTAKGAPTYSPPSDSEGVMTMSNVTGISTAAHKCNLCDTPYLFIVSIGGRTGSTTVLNMLNAIPNVRLAGENGGEIQYMTSLYEEAAHVLGHGGQELLCPNPNDGASKCGAFQRGAVSPTNVLCDLRAYFDDISVPVFPLLPKPAVSVRGFKDIHWTVTTLAMLRSVFPCARRVYSVRDNAGDADAVKSYVKDFHMNASDAITYAKEQVALQAQLKEEHEQAQAAGSGWKSYWLPLEQMDDPATFNNLLGWMGVSGCSFSSVVRANKGTSGYDVAGGTTVDAMRDLHGKCVVPF